MSTVWLSTLVGVGFMVLISIAYGAHRLEMSRLERIRRASIHRDRFRDLSFILEVIPGKTLKGELPKLITRSMLMHIDMAIELDIRNDDLQGQRNRALQLHEIVHKGLALPASRRGGTIGDQLKAVQRGVKLLKEFILQQHRGGFLSKAAATEYIKSLHEMNLTATVDGLIRQAKHSIGEGNMTLGMRYYQLALTELSKSKIGAHLASQKAEIAEAIKALKADQRAESEAAQEVNKKLVNQISPGGRPDENGDFDRSQAS